MFAWMLLAAMPLPMDELVVSETVDLVELNHYFDLEGRKVFSQWIFWSWEGERHEVIAWRLSKDGFRFQERPPIVTWTEEGRLRQVKGLCWRETHTQYDVELIERERCWKRRELRKP